MTDKNHELASHEVKARRELHDQVALITGGTSGIGLEAARPLHPRRSHRHHLRPQCRARGQGARHCGRTRQRTLIAADLA
ncbi:hypothetical protein OG830_00595 [Streptomyces sp. NBC_00121]|uniref:hypothetical protein n=1 Tax=unclassified Streptomyces TaxID=2593676 RepID=UPI002DDB2C6F|nr:hypothetical protein [Streptomyces sp. NBC_01760]WSC67064.1 hypothetical protein OG807_00615 [Streptomyces sp. NBC_01760]